MFNRYQFTSALIGCWLLACSFTVYAQRQFPEETEQKKAPPPASSIPGKERKKTESPWDKLMSAANRACQQGDYQKAEDSYRKALTLAANEKEQEQTRAALIECYRNVAAQMVAKEDYDSAIDYYLRLLTYNPADASRYHSALADALIGRGSRKIYHQSDYDGAILDYTAALEHAPQSTLAYKFRGTARASKMDLDGAMADYQMAKKLDEKNSASYNDLIAGILLMRGNTRANQEDYQGAIKEYQQAIELSPHNQKIYESSAMARISAGVKIICLARI